METLRFLKSFETHLTTLCEYFAKICFENFDNFCGKVSVNFFKKMCTKFVEILIILNIEE